MKYLLDTHTLKWILEGDDNLFKGVIREVEYPKNTIFVSTINLWEITLKSSIGKLVIEGLELEVLPALIQQMSFELLNLSGEDASTFYNLGSYRHRDPFDRMLIWQALRNNLTILTKDPYIKEYQDIGLKTYW